MRAPLTSALCITALAASSARAAPSPELTRLRVVEAHETRTRALAFDPTGRALVSGGSDRRIHVFDGRTLQRRATWIAPAREKYEP